MGKTEVAIHVSHLLQEKHEKSVIFIEQKQDIRWPVSPDPIAGSGVDPLRSSIFLKLSADNLFVFKWLQAHVYFFKIHIKYVVFMLVSTRTITILISNWPQKQKFSQFV